MDIIINCSEENSIPLVSKFSKLTVVLEKDNTRRDAVPSRLQRWVVLKSEVCICETNCRISRNARYRCAKSGAGHLRSISVGER